MKSIGFHQPNDSSDIANPLASGREGSSSGPVLDQSDEADDAEDLEINAENYKTISSIDKSKEFKNGIISHVIGGNGMCNGIINVLSNLDSKDSINILDIPRIKERDVKCNVSPQSFDSLTNSVNEIESLGSTLSATHTYHSGVISNKSSSNNIDAKLQNDDKPLLNKKISMLNFSTEENNGANCSDKVIKISFPDISNQITCSNHDSNPIYNGPNKSFTDITSHFNNKVEVLETIDKNVTVPLYDDNELLNTELLNLPECTVNCSNTAQTIVSDFQRTASSSDSNKDVTVNTLIIGGRNVKATQQSLTESDGNLKSENPDATQSDPVKSNNKESFINAYNEILIDSSHVLLNTEKEMTRHLNSIQESNKNNGTENSNESKECDSLSNASLFSDTPDNSQTELMNTISNAVTLILANNSKGNQSNVSLDGLNKSVSLECDKLFSNSNSPLRNQQCDINFTSAFKILNIIPEEKSEEEVSNGKTFSGAFSSSNKCSYSNLDNQVLIRTSKPEICKSLYDISYAQLNVPGNSKLQNNESLKIHANTSESSHIIASNDTKQMLEHCEILKSDIKGDDKILPSPITDINYFNDENKFVESKSPLVSSSDFKNTSIEFNVSSEREKKCTELTEENLHNDDFNENCSGNSYSFGVAEYDHKNKQKSKEVCLLNYDSATLDSQFTSTNGGTSFHSLKVSIPRELLEGEFSKAKEGCNIEIMASVDTTRCKSLYSVPEIFSQKYVDIVLNRQCNYYSSIIQIQSSDMNQRFSGVSVQSHRQKLSSVDVHEHNSLCTVSEKLTYKFEEEDARNKMFDSQSNRRPLKDNGESLICSNKQAKSSSNIHCYDQIQQSQIPWCHQDSLKSEFESNEVHHIIETTKVVNTSQSNSGCDVMTNSTDHPTNDSSTDHHPTDIDEKDFFSDNFQSVESSFIKFLNRKKELLSGPCILCQPTESTESVFYEDLSSHVSAAHICLTFIPVYQTDAFIHHMKERVGDVVNLFNDASHGNPNHICKDCGSVFKTMNSVRLHLNVHQDIYTIQSSSQASLCTCDKIYYTYSQQKWKTLLIKSEYICSFCHYAFACENSLLNHLKVVHFFSCLCQRCSFQADIENKTLLLEHNTLHLSDKQDDLNMFPLAAPEQSMNQANFSWIALDNHLNYLDGKRFRLNVLKDVKDLEHKRDYLNLPMKVDPAFATIPDNMVLSPTPEMSKYLKSKKDFGIKNVEGIDYVTKEIDLNVQIMLQKKFSVKKKKDRKFVDKRKKMPLPFYLDLKCPYMNKIKDTSQRTEIQQSTRRKYARKAKIQNQKNEKQQLQNENDEDEEGITIVSRTRSGARPNEENEESEEDLSTEVPSTEITGEWVNLHTFVCCSCGAVFLDLAEIMDHKWEAHPGVWCAHTMVKGQPMVPKLFREQYLPPTSNLPTKPLNDALKPKQKGKRKEKHICSHCKVKFESVQELHFHIIECGGLNQIVASKKKIKKGFRFNRRKGQGVPNRRYGSNSFSGTPHKNGSIEGVSGTSTPNKDPHLRGNVPSTSLGHIKRKLSMTIDSLKSKKTTLKRKLRQAVVTNQKKVKANSLRSVRRILRKGLRKRLPQKQVKNSDENESEKKKIKNKIPVKKKSDGSNDIPPNKKSMKNKIVSKTKPRDSVSLQSKKKINKAVPNNISNFNTDNLKINNSGVEIKDVQVKLETLSKKSLLNKIGKLLPQSKKIGDMSKENVTEIDDSHSVLLSRRVAKTKITNKGAKESLRKRKTYNRRSEILLLVEGLGIDSETNSVDSQLKLPLKRKQIPKSNSVLEEDSLSPKHDTDSSDPEIIRNFRRNRTRGRIGLRKKRMLAARYSLRPSCNTVSENVSNEQDGAPDEKLCSKSKMEFDVGDYNEGGDVLLDEVKASRSEKEPCSDIVEGVDKKAKKIQKKQPKLNEKIHETIENSAMLNKSKSKMVMKPTLKCSKVRNARSKSFSFDSENLLLASPRRRSSVNSTCSSKSVGSLGDRDLSIIKETETEMIVVPKSKTSRRRSSVNSNCSAKSINSINSNMPVLKPADDDTLPSKIPNRRGSVNSTCSSQSTSSKKDENMSNMKLVSKTVEAKSVHPTVLEAGPLGEQQPALIKKPKKFTEKRKKRRKKIVAVDSDTQSDGEKLHKKMEFMDKDTMTGENEGTEQKYSFRTRHKKIFKKLRKRRKKFYSPKFLSDTDDSICGDINNFDKKESINCLKNDKLLLSECNKSCEKFDSMEEDVLSNSQIPIQRNIIKKRKLKSKKAVPNKRIKKNDISEENKRFQSLEGSHEANLETYTSEEDKNSLSPPQNTELKQGKKHIIKRKIFRFSQQSKSLDKIKHKRILKEAQILTYKPLNTEDSEQLSTKENNLNELDKDEFDRKVNETNTRTFKKRTKITCDENSPTAIHRPKRLRKAKESMDYNEDVETVNFFCVDCGLSFDSALSREDHRQDCRNIAFEMSLMAEDHLYECPHCQLTFALKGTQRKHIASCRMGRVRKQTQRRKRASNSSSEAKVTSEFLEPLEENATEAWSFPPASEELETRLKETAMEMKSIGDRLSSLCNDLIGAKEICSLLLRYKLCTNDLQHLLTSSAQDSTTRVSINVNEFTVPASTQSPNYETLQHILNRTSCLNLKSLSDSTSDIPFILDDSKGISLDGYDTNTSTSQVTIEASRSDVLAALSVVEELLNETDVLESLVKKEQVLVTMSTNFQAGTGS